MHAALKEQKQYNKEYPSLQKKPEQGKKARVSVSKLLGCHSSSNVVKTLVFKATATKPNRRVVIALDVARDQLARELAKRANAIRVMENVANGGSKPSYRLTTDHMAQAFVFAAPFAPKSLLESFVAVGSKSKDLCRTMRAMDFNMATSFSTNEMVGLNFENIKDLGKLEAIQEVESALFEASETDEILQKYVHKSLHSMIFQTTGRLKSGVRRKYSPAFKLIRAAYKNYRKLETLLVKGDEIVKGRLLEFVDNFKKFKRGKGGLKTGFDDFYKTNYSKNDDFDKALDIALGFRLVSMAEELNISISGKMNDQELGTYLNSLKDDKDSKSSKKDSNNNRKKNSNNSRKKKATAKKASGNNDDFSDDSSDDSNSDDDDDDDGDDATEEEYEGESEDSEERRAVRDPGPVPTFKQVRKNSAVADRRAKSNPATKKANADTELENLTSAIADPDPGQSSATYQKISAVIGNILTKENPPRKGKAKGKKGKKGKRKAVRS